MDAAGKPRSCSWKSHWTLHGRAGHKPTVVWKRAGKGTKLLKGPGGSLGSVRKNLAQSPGNYFKLLKGPGGSLGSVRKNLAQSSGEERPLDAAGEGAKPKKRMLHKGNTVSGGAARVVPVRRTSCESLPER